MGAWNTMMGWIAASAATMALIGAGTAGAATESITHTVDANMAGSIDIGFTSLTDADETTSMLSMTAGASNSSSVTLRVQSTTNYKVEAISNETGKDPSAAAKFQEYNTSITSPGFQTTNPKIINAAVTVAGSAGTIAGGTGSSVTLSTTAQQIWSAGAHGEGTMTSTVSVTPPWGTPELPAGKVYRLVITYTATTTGV